MNPVDLARYRQEQYVFLRQGDAWIVVFLTERMLVKDSKGMKYLAEMLAQPNPARPIQVGGTRPVEQFTDQPFSDAVARAKYEKRNTELREQIDEAKANHDFGRLEKLKEERRALAEEISRAVNVHGRERAFPSPAKNQVLAMRRAIDRAIERLRPNFPNLADHLNDSIARDCFAYRPGPTPPSWVLSEGAGEDKILSLEDGATLVPTRRVHMVQGAGRSVTLDQDRPIAEGSADEQLLRLEGAHAVNTVELRSSGTCAGMNGDVIIGLYKSIQLQWNGTARVWVETSRSH